MIASLRDEIRTWNLETELLIMVRGSLLGRDINFVGRHLQTGFIVSLPPR
jgi:hypothetical protein